MLDGKCEGCFPEQTESDVEWCRNTSFILANYGNNFIIVEKGGKGKV